MMKSKLIKTSVLKAMGYKQYLEIMNHLVVEKKATGDEQTSQRIEFTKLNSVRMRRLDKTIVIPEEALESYKNLKEKQIWLVILESWCADGAQTIPILNKIAQAISNIDLKIVLRDENLELMDCFLTHGTQSIPKLIILDMEYNVINTWGPRSTFATTMVSDYKNEKGKIDEAFKLRLQNWYNADRGQAIINDLLKLINVKSNIASV